MQPWEEVLCVNRTGHILKSPCAQDCNFCIHRNLGFEWQVLTSTGSWGPDPEQVHYMKRSILKFWHDESGATAIEYGLIAAAIALAIIAILNGIGLHLADMLASLNASLK